MQEVQKRAEGLSRAKKRFKNRVIDEYELARWQRAYEFALKKYTDPMGRKK